MRDKIYQISKAHTVYKTADGKRVPGATTITGLRAKPFLITWANRLGLEGVDCTKYRDEAADVGTLAHAMIQAHIQGLEIDESQWSPLQLDLAANAFLKYLEWEKGNDVEPIYSELKMVSEKYRFGGTMDFYCNLNGIPTLVDFKTGKAIYDEHFVQVAGYAEAAKELGYPVEQIKILRIGRDETEGFEERTVKDWTEYFNIFKSLRDIYYAEKRLKWAN